MTLKEALGVSTDALIIITNDNDATFFFMKERNTSVQL